MSDDNMHEEDALKLPAITMPVNELAITELKKMYSDPPGDLSVKDNYEFVRAGIAKMRGMRGKIEKRRKELKASALEFGREVDATAKSLTAGISEIEEPYAEAKEEYDTKVKLEKLRKVKEEENRVNDISARIARIKAIVSTAVLFDAAKIEEIIRTVHGEREGLVYWAMEFADSANEAIDAALAGLTELYNLKKTQEEAARVAAEAEERRKIEEEARKQEEEKRRREEAERLAAERKKLDEERRKMEEEKKAEEARRREEDRIRLEEVRKEEERLQQQREELARQTEILNKTVIQPPDIPVEVSTARQHGDESNEEENHIEIISAATKSITEKRQEAGKVLFALTKNKAAVVAVLDAIIAGAVPHIGWK